MFVVIGSTDSKKIEQGCNGILSLENRLIIHIIENMNTNVEKFENFGFKDNHQGIPFLYRQTKRKEANTIMSEKRDS
jgi:hypothetical protein